MRYTLLIASLVWVCARAAEAEAQTLAGEWIIEGAAERRLALMEDGAFELSLSGGAAHPQFLIVTLEMTSDKNALAYGVARSDSPEFVPSVPSAQVYHIAAPIDTHSQMMRGVWSWTEASLHLMVNEFEISQVDGLPVTELVGNLIQEKLDSPDLDDDVRRGLSAALERVAPISVSQADPFEEIVWEISFSGDNLSVADPNGTFTGDWRRASIGTAIAASGWAETKIHASE